MRSVAGRVILGAALLSLLLLTSALGVTYHGSLQYDPSYPADSGDGLFVGPSNLQWQGYTVTMEWWVTDEDTSYSGYPWKYTYNFRHNGIQAGFSHVIIEASDGFAANDMIGLQNAQVISDIGEQRVTSGNPNMSEDINGIRFDPLASGLFDWTWSFWSDRAPVWGDFYGRCGGKQGGINYAYNYNNTGGVEKGFLDPNADDSLRDDIDPTVAAQNGTVDFHILRPDSVVVPEPASALGFLGCLGAMGAMIRRRKR